ncbi:MAG: FtsX-like permease family protein [Steroidobacteraceae bacterium]
MSVWTLVQAELWRRPERSIFTVVSLAVGFLLFGLLQSVNAAFGAAVARSHADRLMVSARFNHPIPLSYLSQIERVPGVKQVTWLGLLPAYYRDSKQQLMVLATSPARFFSVLDEYKTSATALNRLIRTRTGIIVLDTVAKRFGWKVGDRISLINGHHGWTFDIVGIVTCPSNPAQDPFAVINYTYFDATRESARGTVAWFYVHVADPRRAASVGRSIDKFFANSSAPTLSEQESKFAAQGVSEIGDVRWLTDSIIIAVFFAMLFLTGNVVFESVRERTSEFAVLKTLGYSHLRVLMLIELEALALCLSGAVIGLGLAAVAFHFVGRTLGKISDFLATANVLSPAIILAGVGLAVALTFIAAAIPAWRAKRLDIVDALRVRA